MVGARCFALRHCVLEMTALDLDELFVVLCWLAYRNPPHALRTHKHGAIKFMHGPTILRTNISRHLQHNRHRGRLGEFGRYVA